MMPLSSDADVQQRRFVLSEHMHHYKVNLKKKYSIKDMQKLLVKAGFRVSVSTISKDIEIIECETNSFIEKKIGLNYSKYMQDRFDSLQHVINEAWDIIGKKWTQSKQIKKEITTEKGNTTTNEITITQEMASPKLQALGIITNTENILINLASGKNLELSAALWIRKAKQYEEEINGLKEQIRKNDERK